MLLLQVAAGVSGVSLTVTEYGTTAICNLQFQTDLNTISSASVGLVMLGLGFT